MSSKLRVRGSVNLRVVVAGCLLLLAGIALWNSEVLRAAFNAEDPPLTVGEFLHRQQGDRWPAARTSALERGWLTTEYLDSAIDEREISPWEHVEPMLRDTLVGSGFKDSWHRARFSKAWIEESGFMDPRVNPRQEGLSEEKLEDLLRLNEDFQQALQPLIDSAIVALMLALQDTLDRGDYLACPIVPDQSWVTPKPKAGAGGFRYLESMSLHGWNIVVEVVAQDYPELKAAVTAIDELNHQRIHEIKGSLGG